MHAWLCETLDGVESLQWRELPTPEPAAGEVRIRVHAASLNFPDLLVVRGHYQVKPPLPFVPGAEYSGHVEAIGAGVEHLKIGDAVAAVGVCGGFGTHALANAAHVIRLPAGFDLADAAAFAFTYGTAHHALMDRGALRAGETVLILGAAGGVGSAAVQVAKAAGARVIAAASTDDKCARCLDLGADDTVNYSRENLREVLKQMTHGKGVDVVLDPVGGEWAQDAFRAIAWRGRYLIVGFAGGASPALPWNLPLLKGASMVGVFWGEFVRREPQALKPALGELMRWYAEGRIKPLIDARLPMSELVQAYARMGTRQVCGKLLLLND